ncbi:MAG: ribonuclease HII [Sulfobacillus thermosulfidooxidans]|uniref:Ribonuclease HII n=1 Tax=Sulfobacillus thermosulfidooxidans TaxID=28034 RepID=A0A2T2X5V4_SULTH|nr:MAG: ribonuclease HII [Sulfobacillus thermosulfidooxidans]
MTERLNQEVGWFAKIQWEQQFWRKGWAVAGVDEVGRGPLAGPVVAAAVILDPNTDIMGIDDSKKLSALKRQQLYEEICRTAIAIGVGAVGPRTIERINILEASRMAMSRALGHLTIRPRVVLTDAMRIGGPWEEWPIVHGDQVSASIGAASVIAKVIRDRYMQELALQFPVYGFEQHKGYPTAYHRAMILQHGPSTAHRRSFLRKMMSSAQELVDFSL